MATDNYAQRQLQGGHNKNKMEVLRKLKRPSPGKSSNY